MSTTLKSLPRIVCILGPTGSGKNDLALALADFFRIQIVNFDSRQVYKDLEVVTAQPTREEQEKCPHHLYGFLDPSREINAGTFVTWAKDSIAWAGKNDRVPVLVGGTGLYLQSLIYGLAPIPAVSESIREQVLKRCRELGPEVLHRELQGIDPEYAAKISSRDKQRVTRAWEVYLSSGRTLSQWHKDHDPCPAFRVLKLGVYLPQEELKVNLEKRIKRMIQKGAVQEVRQVWRKNSFCRDLPGLAGIGCPEILDYLEGKLGFERCLQNWYRNTRKYAKRQLTWFRKEPDVHWVLPYQVLEAKELIQDYLSS